MRIFICTVQKLPKIIKLLNLDLYIILSFVCFLLNVLIALFPPSSHQKDSFCFSKLSYLNTRFFLFENKTNYKYRDKNELEIFQHRGFIILRNYEFKHGQLNWHQSNNQFYRHALDASRVCSNLYDGFLFFPILDFINLKTNMF